MATPGQPPPPPSVQTLLIRHLPEGLPPDTLKRLFSHYGASDARLCNAGRLKGCAFVDFENEAVCARAQSQLHRLKFLGKTLFVERAKPAPEKDVIAQEDSKIANTDKVIGVLDVPPPPPPPPPPLPPQQNVSQTGGDPIAPGLGVDYPFPPHLEYAYPPPDGNILTNIVNALIAVPRFYTQVLHLMNKMNLPAPFRAALPTPPLPPPLPPPVPFPSVGKRQAGELSSGESELESSDEERVNAVTEDVLDGTENEPDSHQSRRKRAKLEAVLGPAVDKDASHEAAGVKPISIVPKNAPIKKNKPVMQIKITPKVPIGEGTSRDKGGQAELDAQKEVEDLNRTATREELQAGQLPATDILSLPMFKNYSPGAPTQVLYIKNLGKEVAPDDLFHVYGAFFANLEEAKATLNVKLMQEGRMRGQAFVTFPSIELAQEALELTNGYILKGKPMVIQFGRNPSAAKPPIPT